MTLGQRLVIWFDYVWEELQIESSRTVFHRFSSVFHEQIVRVESVTRAPGTKNGRDLGRERQRFAGQRVTMARVSLHSGTERLATGGGGVWQRNWEYKDDTIKETFGVTGLARRKSRTRKKERKIVRENERETDNERNMRWWSEIEKNIKPAW